MFDTGTNLADRPRTIVVGAGIGGLACALRLAHAGHAVTVLDRHNHPGGKMRQVDSPAGPVDAGPTVLTMRPVFDSLFADVGARLEDHVTLTRQNVLARHFWPDGSDLTLWNNRGRNLDAIDGFAGPRAADEFRRFCADMERLYAAFDAPMMRAPDPSVGRLTGRVLLDPGLIWAMAPLATMRTDLRRRFSDMRLAQLFARYATYVGGHPGLTPALLSLIWRAEEQGVWAVDGGMQALARAIADLAATRGAVLRLGTDVSRIETGNGRVTGVTLINGERLAADTVVFNGDPRALATCALGTGVAQVATQTLTTRRSLSARVWAFAATPEGPDLAHHNVFFAADPDEEFASIAAGQMPTDPTIYVCAQDRGQGQPPPLVERFEIILNAAPLTDAQRPDKEAQTCHQRTFPTLARFGLTFRAEPGPEALTTPSDWNRLFPASAGSLYGQSPHGMTASLKRPRARTTIAGLYLVGGGTHPGAGVPMATLSGQHAAAAILKDRTLT
ncbi:phytoene desaturase family protein [Lutimaribacter sp. EGI FJ00015]|uniref:Phytoene desaturase family protein n=1 Tax=Lutimaribacter degradans TaxID=2945989 RepID=A0ACC5ZV21_9RHOB|nr:1-hydroxycarotenoid 3,4-desaturase CrtD [Lutimaribacter sp. EGI FJ00013]MCM2562033.1 phytoene desaturase family protein [Lutimaribacter sp. EGI FJ00013]MCO0612935.1 phytoene desaturase family protein [Lutimaribacter sp. EGI FJ00015]MCO0635865.1 phytoene desaturase family protein [Lutimaribacter sp. EGI FJ00014]